MMSVLLLTSFVVRLPTLFISTCLSLSQAANALLAQRISSMNAMAAICEATGADVDEVAHACGLDKRIGPKFLKASVGFGGSCFQKDILNLVYLSESLGLPQVAEYWQQVSPFSSNSSVPDSLFGFWDSSCPSLSLSCRSSRWTSGPSLDLLKRWLGLYSTLSPWRRLLSWVSPSNRTLETLWVHFRSCRRECFRTSQLTMSSIFPWSLSLWQRESAAITLCKYFRQENAFVSIYDPKVPHEQIWLDLTEPGVVDDREAGEWFNVLPLAVLLFAEKSCRFSKF